MMGGFIKAMKKGLMECFFGAELVIKSIVLDLWARASSFAHVAWPMTAPSLLNYRESVWHLEVRRLALHGWWNDQPSKLVRSLFAFGLFFCFCL